MVPHILREWQGGVGMDIWVVIPSNDHDGFGFMDMFVIRGEPFDQVFYANYFVLKGYARPMHDIGKGRITTDEVNRMFGVAIDLMGGVAHEHDINVPQHLAYRYQRKGRIAVISTFALLYSIADGPDDSAEVEKLKKLLPKDSN